MNNEIKFTNGKNCTTGATWTHREMTAEEVSLVCKAVAVNGQKNVTVRKVHIDGDTVEIYGAVNNLSRAKYPNNHREFQITTNTKAQEWNGWL